MSAHIGAIGHLRPYGLDAHDVKPLVEKARERVRKRRKRELEVEEEADSGPRVHLSARENIVHWGAASSF